MFNDLANKKIKRDSEKEPEQENIRVSFSEPLEQKEIHAEVLQEPSSETNQGAKILEKLLKKKNPKIDVSNTKPKVSDTEADDDEIFSKTGTKIEGKNKIILKAKITQYKSLFKEKLKGFKVKANATEAELQDAINEMEILINVGTFDEFLTEAILSCLRMMENISIYTKFDISGTADLLKANPQFDSLAKQIFLKYKIFTNVSPELQMFMLISITASFSIIRNKKQKESFFNSPVN